MSQGWGAHRVRRSRARQSHRGRGRTYCHREPPRKCPHGQEIFLTWTYVWIDIPNQNHPNQLVGQQIKTAIENALGAKGLTKSATAAADLQIAYQVAVDAERQWNAYGGMGGLRFGGVGTATSSTINIGSLVLDIFDPVAKQQIWTGEATKTMNPSDNPEKNQKNLEKAVAKLLKNFPPPQK